MENLNNQLKKKGVNQEKEIKKYLKENLNLKEDIENMQLEIKELKDEKDKLFKTEKKVIEMENILIMKNYLLLIKD